MIFVCDLFLAPGGSVVQETDQSKPWKTDVCLFAHEATHEKIKGFYEVGACYVLKKT